MMRLLFALFVLFTVSHSALAAEPCTTGTPDCRHVSTAKSGGQYEFYSNYDLSAVNPNITSAVIRIHGISRHAAGAFGEMPALFPDQRGETTLIVSPHFPASTDLPGPGFIYWDVNGWPAGDKSLDATQTSSYEVLDELILQMGNKKIFPNLTDITITGMSAGGQTTQRYAGGGLAKDLLPSIAFHYVVISPSSYMYLDNERWNSGTQYDFLVPSQPQCTYDNYRYGLENLNAYMAQMSPGQIISQYLSQDISYVVGDQDDATARPTTPILNDPKDAIDLDVSCAAEYQGNSRLQRAIVFDEYLRTKFPNDSHTLTIVPGVAHQDIIFTNAIVENLLYRGQ